MGLKTVLAVGLIGLSASLLGDEARLGAVAVEGGLEKHEAILKEALATPGLTDAERRRVRAMSVLPRHAILTREFRLAYDGFDVKTVAPDYVEKGLRLMDFRINEVRPAVTPVNWGSTFRGFPFEVRYWGPAGLRTELLKRYPEMGTLL